MRDWVISEKKILTPDPCFLKFPPEISVNNCPILTVTLVLEKGCCPRMVNSANFVKCHS